MGDSYPQEALQSGETVILRRLVRVERQLSSGGSSGWRGSYPQEARQGGEAVILRRLVRVER